MLKYINNSTGEELPVLNLTCALDAFKEVYFNAPKGFDSFTISHMNKSSILELETPQRIVEFHEGDCFYSQVDNYIILGRVFNNQMYLVRTSNQGRVFFINVLERESFINSDKNNYFRLDPVVFRIWMDLFMNESLSRITWNI